jgi:Ca-activated chloride channel family protein
MSIVVVGFIGLVFLALQLKPLPNVGGNDISSTQSENEVFVTLSSSSTKRDWIDAVIEQFNNQSLTTSSGNPIIVEARHGNSGDQENDIFEGLDQPVAWSPGEDAWVKQLNENWRLKNGKLIISEEPCKSTVYTPLGIAMWRPMAEALGWPDNEIDWQTILELAAHPEGWASYNRPNWGKFRFGHAHPEYSNAGLLTLTSFIYDITGETQLTPEKTLEPTVKEEMYKLQQKTFRYGVSSVNLLDLMANQGRSYLHAVATFESDMIRTNERILQRSQGSDDPWSLVFIVPSNGTFWSNHPYCILDNADWVNEEEEEAAQIFLDYLLDSDQQQLAVEKLLRPLDNSIPVDSVLNVENGTQPDIKREPLSSPDDNLSRAIIDLFYSTKRKATVIIVLDISGSMVEDNRIDVVIDATVDFLGRLHPDDEVAIITFANEVQWLIEPTRVGNAGENLKDQILTLIAEGETALYEAVCEATERVDQLQSENETEGESRLYGIVLLSDGADTVNEITETDMFSNCLPTNIEADGVKIFPVAFGDEVSEVDQVLLRIADVTGGKRFEADKDSIDEVYLSISAEQ